MLCATLLLVCLTTYMKPLPSSLQPVCDRKRHLACRPYSLPNLHKVAEALGIKRCWFHKNHYDIPATRIKEITEQCQVVSSKEIVNIINEAQDPTLELV